MSLDPDCSKQRHDVYRFPACAAETTASQLELYWKGDKTPDPRYVGAVGTFHAPMVAVRFSDGARPAGKHRAGAKDADDVCPDPLDTSPGGRCQAADSGTAAPVANSLLDACKPRMPIKPPAPARATRLDHGSSANGLDRYAPRPRVPNSVAAFRKMYHAGMTGRSRGLRIPRKVGSAEL